VLNPTLLRSRRFDRQVVVSLPDMVKGKTAIRVFNKFKKKPYWGNHFWTEGYCVDTVGLDSEMIKKSVKYQENIERRTEQ
jgi:putative transposase